MRRREFVGLLGGAAAWPVGARGQQSDKVRRIAVLMASQDGDRAQELGLAVFRQSLAELGWMEGSNLSTEYRWSGSNPALMQRFAKELVVMQPDVLIGHTTPVVAALMRETATIPIVFVIVSDPVGSGFVESLALPGRNATGFVNIEASLGGKWLELLKEAVPTIRRVSLLFNPETAPHAHFYQRPFESAARVLNLEAVPVLVRGTGELQAQLEILGSMPDCGIVVMPDIFVSQHRAAIISAAARHKIPVIYPYRFMAQEGGLISYGIDNVDMYRRAAPYIDRILRGAKPSSLPVQLPTKFELVVNLKTAKALGLTIPESLLARADEVIE